MSLNNNQTIPYVWSPLSGNTVKVNMDAVWNSRNGKAGLRIIIRDSQCKFTAAKIVQITTSSALEDEAHALIWGSMFAQERGKRNVILESDSRSVTQCLNGNVAKRAWTLYPIVCKFK
ncbi:hypothetical protein L3X38_005592 [Prunus dulcis]|uniref:RNase H type-1 domain-containing protein n=1 Tax=Prunus dulcis TaxID=3755 RepID=A0AAD4ZRA0_PRUDU|nr:hypothetical protein L3X38_005592 [Prunus dulcis]